METRTLSSRHRIIADLAAFADGQPFLIVEVKAMHGAAALAAGWLINLLHRFKEDSGREVPFGMVVDLDDILVFDLRRPDPAMPVCGFKTREILEAYDPDFAHKPIYDDYLQALVERWLRMFGWRMSLASPRGAKELTEAGLADLLNRGSISRQVPLADADPVR
jgi:hypothetical protein